MTDKPLHPPRSVRIKLEAVDDTDAVMLLDVRLSADAHIEGSWEVYGKITDYDENELLQDYPIILSKDGELEFSPAENTCYSTDLREQTIKEDGACTVWEDGERGRGNGEAWKYRIVQISVLGEKPAD